MSKSTVFHDEFPVFSCILYYYATFCNIAPCLETAISSQRRPHPVQSKQVNVASKTDRGVVN